MLSKVSEAVEEPTLSGAEGSTNPFERRRVLSASKVGI